MIQVEPCPVLVGWEPPLNRRGTTFRTLSDAETGDLDADRAIAVMMSHPSAMRRPVIDLGDELVIGFDPKRYAALAKEPDRAHPRARSGEE